MNPNAHRRGMTFIEVLFSTALFAVLMLILSVFLLHFDPFYEFQTAFGESADSTSASLAAIRDAVLQADAVSGGHVFSGITYASATTTLVLELPSVDTSGAVVAGAHDYEAFTASSTVLYWIIDADPSSARVSGTKRLTQALSSLAFSYDATPATAATAVTAALSTSATAGRETAGSAATTTARLRN
jgi:prepilin-type N-terminal cleavage/methylation domain-containing protein